MKLTLEIFDCIKEDNSEEENEKQWEHSKEIFDEYENYLLSNGIDKKTAIRHVNNIIIFTMKYYFVYENGNSLLFTNDITIRKYLGNWYIRKSLNPNVKIIKSYLSSLIIFLKFLLKQELIIKEEYEKIESVCKDIQWFENRLKTYFSSEDEDFRLWIEDYDYDYYN